MYMISLSNSTHVRLEMEKFSLLDMPISVNKMSEKSGIWQNKKKYNEKYKYRNIVEREKLEKFIRKIRIVVFSFS